MILVVDDNPTTRKVFHLTLDAEGYRVVEAPGAAAALAWATKGMPALALVDSGPPRPRRTRAVRRLRALPGGAELPVVAVSGYLGLAADARMPLGDFDAVVAKPVEPQRLVELVRSYVPGDGRGPVKPGHGKHVLVADDDPVQLKLTAVHLRHAGFRVSTAPSGDAALALARASPPDLIVSDVLMPGLDGFGLCVEVRADPRLASVPLVLASAHYREAADDELARRVGANAFVVRSCDPGDIVRAVQAQIGAAAPPVTLEPPLVIAEAHRQRIVQQLERQALTNDGMVRRCAVQAAQLSICWASPTRWRRAATLSTPSTTCSPRASTPADIEGRALPHRRGRAPRPRQRARLLGRRAHAAGDRLRTPARARFGCWPPASPSPSAPRPPASTTPTPSSLTSASARR